MRKKQIALFLIIVLLVTIFPENSILVKADNRSISAEGLELIKGFEGFSSVPYKALPSETYYTIGYGHYGADVYLGMTVTVEQAEQMLRNDIQRYEGYVNTFLNSHSIAVNQKQYDALVSFTYNLGNVWVSTPTFQLKTYLINGISNYSDEQITTAFTNWCKDGSGNVINGLVTRRRKEAEYFLQDMNTNVDKQNPVIYSAVVADYNSDGYVMKIKAEDENGIKKCQVVTWTSNNGQDDLLWRTATYQNGEYILWIPYAEHPDGKDLYNHVYVFDNAENQTVYSCDWHRIINVESVSITDEKGNPRSNLLVNEIGKTITLKANISPNDADNTDVSWSTSDSSVVSVDSNGKITTKKEGTAQITVRTSDGNYSDVCNIKVKTTGSIYGDCNGDGTITATDLSMLNYFIKETEQLTEEEVKISDLNGDGAINEADAELLKQFVLGTITSFPVEKQLPEETMTPTTIPTQKPTQTPIIVSTAIPTVVPTVVPTTAPTAIPTVVPINVSTETPDNKQQDKQDSYDKYDIIEVGDEEEEDENQLQEGDIFEVKSAIYEITDISDTPTVELIAYEKKSVKAVTIPAKVEYEDITYKVTGIGSRVFEKSKKLTAVTIGKNVTTIGAYAFNKDSKLKKVTIKSKKLTTVGKKAFCGVSKKVIVKVPSEKKQQYNQLLKSAGLGK